MTHTCKKTITAVLVLTLLSTIFTASCFAKMKTCNTRAESRNYLEKQIKNFSGKISYRTKYKATKTTVKNDIIYACDSLDQVSSTRMRFGPIWYRVDSSGHVVTLTKVEMKKYKTKKNSASKHRYCQEKATAIVKKLKLNGKSDAEKARAINNYLIDNVKRDYKDNMSHTAWSAFARKSGVCSAFADAYCYLGEAAGLKVAYITGPSTDDKGKVGSHAWNAVKIGKKWYFVDATFGSARNNKTAFLLKGTKNKYFNGSLKVKRGHKRESYYIMNEFTKTHPLSAADFKY